MKRSEHTKRRRSKRCGREAAADPQPSGKPAEEAAGAVQRKPPVRGPQDDAAYWESRAERTRRQAGRYQDQATREHFMKIAAGYEALAASARSVGRGAE
ncbi:MAG: hypothetical protein CFE30_17795 [Bradyrhizobium sp. PARBB1]|nr:MAG: hypothetical protein CFE30_17795 [Bradyrhizobium sp. PARBB1]PSO22627.1 hypothetical protein C7G43_26485 [Bradyrhizobium sp. MOS004]HAQ80042.1 hypothetical protein [Bradyrhizobium sp.]HAR17758.1 hypothetical protein [Bradyrhizobium sp.]HAR27462.1 hypothetical protein [Bradyrhizobium sp.]